MVRNGHKQRNAPQNDGDCTNEDELDWSYNISNSKLYQITNASNITTFYQRQQRNWIAHIVRRNNSHPCKKLTFHTTKRKQRGRPTASIMDHVVVSSGMVKQNLLKKLFTRKKII